MSRYVDNKYYHVSSLHLVMGNVWSKGTVLDTLPIIILKSGYMKIKTARISGCVFITPCFSSAEARRFNTMVVICLSLFTALSLLCPKM